MYQEPYLKERMATAVYAREMAAAFFGGEYHPRAEALYHRVLNDNKTFEAWRDYRRENPVPRAVRTLRTSGDAGPYKGPKRESGRYGAFSGA